jgi:DNA primase
MKRFPDGVQGKAFYEKDAPKHTPAWIQTTEVPRQAGGKPIIRSLECSTPSCKTGEEQVYSSFHSEATDCMAAR